jgi:hypothetical protein
VRERRWRTIRELPDDGESRAFKRRVEGASGTGKGWRLCTGVRCQGSDIQVYVRAAKAVHKTIHFSCLKHLALSIGSIDGRLARFSGVEAMMPVARGV